MRDTVHLDDRVCEDEGHGSAAKDPGKPVPVSAEEAWRGSLAKQDLAVMKPSYRSRGPIFVRE